MARILIIDDDAAFRATLAETVRSLGHVAIESDSAELGLRQLAQVRYAAVFLDYRMPGMDGLEMLAALNARVAHPPPVVMLNAYASGANTTDAMELGAFDHLVKPVGRDAVREVLEKALRREQPVLGS
jgi:CheY-like chemotaxis protein